MSYLILSILALFIGPLAAPLTHGRGWLIAALDGFVLASVGAVVCLELIPHSLEAGAFWALGAIALGMVVPTWIERRSEGAHEHGGGNALVAMVVAGLAIHAAIDGSALALYVLDSDGANAESMALAVLFHRLPVGFVIAWLAPRSWSRVKVLGLAAMVALMTLAGFGLGHELLGQLDAFSLAMFEALVAGLLLHVVLVHPPHGPGMTARTARFASVGGLLVGFGTVILAIQSGERHGAESAIHETHVSDTFLALAAESAPALIAAFVGAGLLRVLMSARLLAWLGRGNAMSQAFRGMAFGLPLPICSCGVVPLYESLIRAGTPAAAALAFLVATPEIGLGAVLISVPLLGMEMTLLRVVCAIAAAWVVAVMTVRVIPPRVAETDQVGLDFQEDSPLPQRLMSGLRYGLEDLVEDVMPWIVVGLGIAAVLEPLLDASGLRDLSPWVQVPLAGLMGMPVYVCASGSTPIVAMLLFSGLSPGAGIAFLLTGPATNIVTFGLLSSLHNRRTAIVFGVSMAVMACGLGWLANAWGPTLSGVAGEGMSHEHGFSLLQIICLVALTLLTFSALLRRGPRALIAKVVPEHQHVHLDGEPCSDQPVTSCCAEPEPAPTSCCPTPEPEPPTKSCCD
ncbi:MAG: permease [Myxococcota bacterium]